MSVYCGPHTEATGGVAAFIDHCLLHGLHPHEVEHMVSTRWSDPFAAVLAGEAVNACSPTCTFVQVLRLLLRAEVLARAER